MLRFYDNKAEIQLFTDASKAGFGAIFWDEEKFDSYTLEVLAVIKAIQKFHVY